MRPLLSAVADSLGVVAVIGVAVLVSVWSLLAGRDWWVR